MHQSYWNYSQAVKVNGFLFISGQIPLDPSTMELVDGIENQINQVFENINQILKADGMDFSNVVKLSVLLNDLDHFEKVNEIMASIFSKPILRELHTKYPNYLRKFS
jgi:reactive intermediate/imine deaminase